MCKVSVIIPTYKHRDFVLQTLASVFAQTFTDYEVIVVNDGSPDDTAELLRPLVETDRIRYIEQDNAGQSAARNRGIREAQGCYIALLDDDDEWPLDKLEWQVAVLDNHPQAIMTYGFANMVGNGIMTRTAQNAPSGAARQAFLHHNWIVSPGQTLIRTQGLRDLGGFDETIWGADDWDIYIQLAGLGEFAYDERCALQYRFHADNASNNVDRMHRNCCRVHRKHLGVIPLPTNYRLWLSSRFTINRLHAADYIRTAARLAPRGDCVAMLRVWLKALRTWPTVLRSPDVRAQLRANLVCCSVVQRNQAGNSH